MIAGLDGVRALAVLLVLGFHNDLFGPGWIGVQIFFVLSGFLITRLLIRDKGMALGAYTRTFYGRRFLRIFPVYYAYLAVIALVMARFEPDKRGQLVYALTYTYDFFHASKAYVHTPLLTHFWSLSVEEQFYLVWPAVIFACPPDRLKRLLLFAASLGPLVRLATYWLLVREGWGSDDRFRDVYVLPLSHFDAFAMGGVLCVWWPRISPRLFYAALVLFLAGVLIQKKLLHAALHLGLSPAYEFVWGYTVIDVLAAMLIVVVADGSVAPSLFRWRPLSYLGKISYGVYIFHYPLTRLSEPIAAAVVPWPRLVHLGSSAIDLVATLLVASASFRWLEQPFLSLKDKWFLSVRAPTQPGALETPAFEPDAGRVSAEAPE